MENILENTLDGHNFDCSICLENRCCLNREMIHQTLCENCVTVQILCSRCVRIQKMCIMTTCRGNLVNWPDFFLTRMARLIRKQCPRKEKCSIMSCLEDIKAPLADCSRQQQYTDDELDGLLTPLKIPRVKRDTYLDSCAQLDLLNILEAFYFAVTFLRRLLQYMEDHPDGDACTMAYRRHLINYIDDTNRNQEIDFVIEAM